jgi:hypothetical protein
LNLPPLPFPSSSPPLENMEHCSKTVALWEQIMEIG